MSRKAEDWEMSQRAYWDRVSGSYDDLYTNTWSLMENEQTQSWLQSLGIERGGLLLDLACGTGLGYELTAARNPKLTYMGVDLSPRMVEVFIRKFPNVNVECAPLRDISRFGMGRFDYVICLNTAFSFVSNPIETIKQIAYVLNAQGRILISALNRWSLRRILRLHIKKLECFSTRGADWRLGYVPALTFTRAELAALLQKGGFRVESVYVQGFFAGVWERPYMIPLERRLALRFPSLCHSFNIIGEKVG